MPALGFIFLVFLPGCIQPLSIPPTSTTTLPTPVVAPSPTSIYPWTDENALMSGICFEAAFDAAGDVFVLRSAEEHIQFYDLVDHSQLCRRAVQRYPFDFSGGRILAGLWSYGQGCTARHEVIHINRDDAARTFDIQLRLITEGDCDYELLRPFWVGLAGLGDYTIQINVE
jgi:hypothetical protein